MPGKIKNLPVLLIILIAAAGCASARPGAARQRDEAPFKKTPNTCGAGAPDGSKPGKPPSATTAIRLQFHLYSTLRSHDPS